MKYSVHTAILAAALLLCGSSVSRAQETADPSGHWEGSVTIPGATLPFEIDLAKDNKGELSGTLSGTDVKNLPLVRVAVSGRSVSLHASSDQPINGVLSADGRTISGTVTVSGYALPLDLTRTGDPRIEPPPTSAPISKELEGTWNGTLNTTRKPLRLVLTMTNQPGGRAIGRILSIDEGGFILPIVITQQASSVSYISTSVPGSWAGSLTADGTELVGTFTQGSESLPLTFRRAPTPGGR